MGNRPQPGPARGDEGPGSGRTTRMCPQGQPTDERADGRTRKEGRREERRERVPERAGESGRPIERAAARRELDRWAAPGHVA